MNDKTNLLFIITDQQRADHLSCAGNPVVKTPYIDSIGDSGIRFTNYFCNTPICMPNRANFFTGSLPSVHGVRSNGINLNPEIPTISEVLKNNGYHTATIGKTHFNHYAPPAQGKGKTMENILEWMLGNVSLPFPTPYYGFDEVALTIGHGDVIAGHYIEWLKEKKYDRVDFISNLDRGLKAIYDYYYDTVLPEELYPTAYITDQTVDFLERHAQGKNGDKPFFLHCSYNDPHHPVCPPGKYRDMYKPEDIELPSNFKDAEKLLDHEFIGQQIRDDRFVHLLPQKVDEKTAKSFVALTYGSIAMIDDGVGKILGTLERLGLADNTMVIFTSDHGDLAGDHGLILKGPAHYRSVINMPLLWKIPGITKKSVSDSLVSTIDLPRTILSILGINKEEYPEAFQGCDITSVLKDAGQKVRERILIEHDEEIAEDKIFRLRTLITERHRLTVYDGYDNTGDIFDLKDDPDEINNLWSTDKELRHSLTEELLREIVSLQLRIPERKAYN